MNLTDTQFGHKRKLVIGGINSWDDLISKSLNIVFYVQVLTQEDEIIDDKSINQNRKVVYELNNTNKVNNQFDKVQTGGIGEYDFFMNYIQVNKDFFATIDILQIKLNQRGIFN